MLKVAADDAGNVYVSDGGNRQVQVFRSDGQFYELPADLEAAIAPFVSYYNYRRDHKALATSHPQMCSGVGAKRS